MTILKIVKVITYNIFKMALKIFKNVLFFENNLNWKFSLFLTAHDDFKTSLKLPRFWQPDGSFLKQLSLHYYFWLI